MYPTQAFCGLNCKMVCDSCRLPVCAPRFCFCSVRFPETVKQQECEFEKVTKARKQGEKFSFYKKGLKNGDKIVFASDASIVAKVAGEREVEYKGQIWKLSPLTREIYREKNQLTSSECYQGAYYFKYKDTRLTKLPDIHC